MTRTSPRSRSLAGMLHRARQLAGEVRLAAERAQAEAAEAHRLTIIARQETERSRTISRDARREASAVKHSLWCIGAAPKPRRSGDD